MNGRRWGVGAAAGAVALAIALGALFQIPQSAFAQPDPGSIGVRLLDVPATSLGDQRARQYIVDHLEPGTVIERRFEISNTTSSATMVEVYPSAATITDGEFLGDAGRSINELTERTTITESKVVVPAFSTVIDTVTIAIPSDAAPGEQYAAIWVEARSSDNLAIEVVNRVGIRMYVSVGGANPPASDFRIESMSASRDDSGAPWVTAVVRNTGGRAIDTSAALTLTKVGGTLSAGPYDSNEGSTIVPGDSGVLLIAVTDEVDAGPWSAALTVTSGLLEIQSDAEITFPAYGSGQEVEVIASPSGFQDWKSLGLLIALALVLAVVAGVSIRRRYRK